MTAVLLRRRSLGDVVLLGAVTGALPGCVVVTDPAYAEVAGRLRGVGAVVAWGEALPAGEVIDLQGGWPWRRRRIRKRSLRRRVGWSRPSVPALYAEACGVRPVPTPWIDGPGGPRDALALIPGASTRIKQWSPASFAALGRRWGGPVVVLGGPGEEGLVDGVAAAIPGARGVAGRGFAAAIGWLGRCRVAVGGDTGLLHLAAACGARPVGLFGPTHPRDGFFPYPEGRVVSLALPCRPCTLHRRPDCPEGHHGCMGQAVPDVWDAVSACASR